MRRYRWIFLICLVSGCSTHPCTDFWDWARPGRAGKNIVVPYGGVGIPQGPIIPVAPNVSVGPPAVFPGGGAVPLPPTLPGGSVVPPPAPLPGGSTPPPIPPPAPPPAGKF